MTEEELEQEGYEAGLQAWEDCMPIMMARIPLGDASATPFIAGFIEAFLMVLLAEGDEESMVHFMKMAMTNAIEHHKEEPLNPAEWRQQ